MQIKDLNICTWNIKNSYIKLYENKTKVTAISYLLDSYDIDVLALQEVNKELFAAIKKELTNVKGNYKIYPNVKKGQFTLNNVIQEYNPIITKEGVTKTGTFKLPSIPDKLTLDIHMRKINEVMLADGTFILNTHLEHNDDELNRKQIQRISDRIMYLKTHFDDPDIIVTGNLNRFPNHTNILSWKRKDLNCFDMKILELNKATYQGHDNSLPVDYIIVPNTYHLEEIKTVKQLEKVSSHLPVYAKLKTK